jgi:hypothetical protein
MFKVFQLFHTHVSSACFHVFQMFETYVAKMEMNIAYVAMAIYTCLKQEHISNVSSVSVVCCKYFIFMFQNEIGCCTYCNARWWLADSGLPQPPGAAVG